MPSTYVSPINRFQAIRGGRLANEGTAIDNSTRQIQNQKAQRGLAEYDKQLRTSSLAIDSLEVLQASPETRAQLIADKAAKDTTGFWQGGAGKTSQELQQMLEMNVRRGKMIGAIPEAKDTRTTAYKQYQEGVADPGFAASQVKPVAKGSPSATIQEGARIAELTAIQNRTKGEEAELAFLTSKMAPSSADRIDAKVAEATALAEVERAQSIIDSLTENTPEWRDAQKTKAAALEQVKLAKKAKTKQISDIGKIRLGIGKMESAMAAANRGNTGLPHALFGWIPGSKAHGFSERVTSIESGLVLDTMMELKNASATGSTGFGQLNEKELKTMQSAIESVALTQNLDDWIPAMETLKKVFDNQLATMMLALETPASSIENRRKQAENAGVAAEDIEFLLKIEYPDEYTMGQTINVQSAPGPIEVTGMSDEELDAAIAAAQK